MKLKKVTLTREGRTCILQGMRHVAPAELYVRIQSEMEEFHRMGFKVIFEGISGPFDPEPHWEESHLRIASTMRSVMMLYPGLARIEGAALQSEMIKYPAGSIRADMTFVELVETLEAGGFRIYKGIAGFIASPDFFKSLEGARKPGRKKWGVEKLLIGFFAALLRLLCSGAYKVMVDDRNEIAAVAIEKHARRSREARMYVHYGDIHIPGIVRMLRKKGWKVQSTEFVRA